IQLQMKLMTKFQFLLEGTVQQGNPTLLNEIYTELYITDAKEINEECEIRQIETAAMKAVTEGTPINCNDIFTPIPKQDQLIRTVLTKGFAGIGKTVSVQKFILDWAEEKANQDIHFIFPLPFRELNLLNDKKLSLLDLLHVFFPETKKMDIFSGKYKVLIIFDGLDECHFPLNFQSNEILQDATKEASVDVLLTNLIAGNLLPSAFIWITSRPAAADLIPSECVHRLTECSAGSATVLEKMLSQAESGEIPKTLTQMYTHFLIIQIKIKHEKDYKMAMNGEDMILKLGKLAFQQLLQGNLIFHEEDMRECGIDVIEASVYSGLCTCREDLHQRKLYSFVHLTIQEHLAALYVHHSFTKNNINVFDVTEPTHEEKNEQVPMFDLHKKAVDEAINSKTGLSDLFLRFLRGFSLKSSQTLLECLLTQTE
ncbi:hypothetical protein M9458_030821, partial [Cirrhinus mrigala]